jgi:hypothetical protein
MAILFNVNNTPPGPQPEWNSIHSYIPEGGTHWYIEDNNSAYGTWSIPQNGYYNTQNYDWVRLGNRLFDPTGGYGWWSSTEEFFQPTGLRITYTGSYTIDFIEIRSALGILYSNSDNHVSGYEYDLSGISWGSHPTIEYNAIWKLRVDFTAIFSAGYITNIEFYGIPV